MKNLLEKFKGLPWVVKAIGSGVVALVLAIMFGWKDPNYQSGFEDFNTFGWAMFVVFSASFLLMIGSFFIKKK